MNKLIKKIVISGIITAAFISSSCATLTNDISIETHADPAIDYSAYKSYAWAGSAQIVYDPVGQWEQPTLDTDEEVKFLIDRELRNNGLIEVKSNPDLLVGFAVGVDMANMELKENPDAETEILTNVPKAALVIALTDAATGYTVWLGYAEGQVQEQQTIDNIRKRIDYAVTQIFKTYND